MPLWGKTDANASVPKDVKGASEIAKVFFVDMTEARIASTKAKGITGPGWWRYTTHTTSSGRVRHMAECLVPMKVTLVAAGDRADDTLLPDA